MSFKGIAKEESKRSINLEFYKVLKGKSFKYNYQGNVEIVAFDVMQITHCLK